MLFNSLEFGVFLPSVLALYWLLPRRLQNPLLLLASYVFYGAWDWRFLGLLLASTVTDYGVARRLPSVTGAGARKRLLGLSLTVNLGVLAFFKYFDFFAESTARLLSTVGLGADGPTLGIILPVGISFYTFQTLAYTIDVYRRRAEPEHNFVTFALYVAFFPQLVAGPIERAQRLLPQLRTERSGLRLEQLRSGALLILLGLFKKIAVADALAPYVDQAFSGAATAGWIELTVGVYAFALQIYGDFSGYTDIARGTARLLGIELMVNFRQPYLARNITHFWRTWHISLSTWLRDYLYIPLGGNRQGRVATYRNLMITMLLGGLWHGAAWTFVAWGALHGLYLAAHRAIRHRTPSGAVDPFRLRDLGPALLTFHAVCFAWIFFRAETFADAFDVIAGIVTMRSGAPDLDAFTLVLGLGLATLFIDLIQRNGLGRFTLVRWPILSRGLAYGLMVVGIIVFGGAEEIPFIYFQF